LLYNDYNYPLNSNQLQGFQIITKIYNNAYQFTINNYATDSTYNLISNNINTKSNKFNEIVKFKSNNLVSTNSNQRNIYLKSNRVNKQQYQQPPYQPQPKH
jgi:hypothetical protein